MVPKHLWVLVCDGGRAFAYSNDGPGHTLRRVAEGEWHADPALASGHQTGTGFAMKGSSARHGVGESEPPSRAAERAFFQHILDALLLLEGAFEQLVIVAPPQAMGEIRKILPARLKSKLAGEVVADLTKSSLQSIAEHVAPHVAVKARLAR